MRKVVKGVLIGAAVGGTIVVVKALRSNEPTDNMTRQAAAVTGGAAVAGALGGWILERRARRKANKRLALAPGTLAEVARAAAPTIGKTTRRTRRLAAKAGRRAAKQAAKAARKMSQPVGKAAELALEQAARLGDVVASRGEAA